MPPLLPTIPEPAIDWCPELSCYVARCPTLFPGALHGDDPHQLLDDLLLAIAEATYADNGFITARLAA